MRIDTFPADQYAEAWRWARQFPLANFDDAGPQSCAEFEQALRARAASEKLFGVWDAADALCGIIGYFPVSGRLGMFHGICFDQAVHGTGIAQQAVSSVLDTLFASGVEKVSAAYFADNARVRHFLASLGARDEGYLHRQTVRGGSAIDMRLVAFFADELKEFLCH